MVLYILYNGAPLNCVLIVEAPASAQSRARRRCGVAAGVQAQRRESPRRRRALEPRNLREQLDAAHTRDRCAQPHRFLRRTIKWCFI